jgi:hypothetical protein
MLIWLLQNVSDGTGGNYGRWTAFNHTHLRYEHVHNVDDNVTDVWWVVQEKHGPFPDEFWF